MDFNAREFKNSKLLNLPYISAGVKFTIHRYSWDVDVDALWQQRAVSGTPNSKVHLLSAGTEIRFGVDDFIPPEIKVGNIQYGD